MLTMTSTLAASPCQQVTSIPFFSLSSPSKRRVLLPLKQLEHLKNISGGFTLTNVEKAVWKGVVLYFQHPLFLFLLLLRTTKSAHKHVIWKRHGKTVYLTHMVTYLCICRNFKCQHFISAAGSSHLGESCPGWISKSRSCWNMCSLIVLSEAAASNAQLRPYVVS